MGPKKCLPKICLGIFWGSKMLFILILFWIASKTCQEGPRGVQEAPGSLQERPKRPQEAPKNAPEGSKRGSRDPKSRSRGLKARPRAPKSLPKRPQGFSEAPGSAAVFGKLKNSNHGSKRHRRHLRSPISMNPKGLASNRRMKKGGRAAVIPLGEVNPPPPEGSERVQTVFELVFRILRTQRV